MGTLDEATVEEITGETYGPLKALCERSVEEAFPGRALIVRPGLIVGPHDPTDRFTYWPARIAEGGEVLAPGDPEASAQWIDVRDLADWMVEMSDRAATGVMNAVGPAKRTSLGELLEVCVDQVAPPDPLVALEVNRFERARDPSHTRALADVDLVQLFEANGLVLLKTRSEREERELSAYLDRAGCTGEARERVLALAPGRQSYTTEIGWYLLEKPGF